MSEDMSEDMSSDMITVPDDDGVVLVDELAAEPQGLNAEADEAEGDQVLPDEGGSDDADSKADAVADDTADGKVPDDPLNDEQARAKKRGKTYQKRIDTLTWKNKDSEERAAAAETKLALVEEELRQEKSTQLLAKRTAALDDGDLEGYAKLNDDLTDLKLDGAKAEAMTEAQVARPEFAASDDDEGALHESAAAWLKRNAWYSENDKLAEAVNQIEATFTGRGVPYGDALYQKIDAVVAADPRFDDVRTPTVVDKEPAAPVEKPNMPSGVVVDSVSEQPSKPGRLSSHDIKTMRTYNLDPNDARHRKTYLKYKA